MSVQKRNIINLDCKQNMLRKFQTVNLSFLSRRGCVVMHDAPSFFR